MNKVNKYQDMSQEWVTVYQRAEDKSKSLLAEIEQEEPTHKAPTLQQLP